MKQITNKLLSTLLAAILSTAVVQGAAAAPASAASYSSSGVICDDRLGEGQIVFYPESLLVQDEATYPVIVWANGTMCAPALYYGLLSGLAEHGYIVVANRELFAGNGNAQRASIDFITAENADAGSVFYGKADLEHIGAAGHSQGGMSAVNAAVADSRIDCVFSIAGNVQTGSAAQLTVPTFYAAGSADWIVPASLYVRPAYNSTPCTAVYASLKGAGHTKCCTSPGSYTGYMNAWFDAYLLGDPSAYQLFVPGGALSHDSSWTGYTSKNL
ncbi:MAG: hypothetical protein J5722_07305, partial [Oscillospiraceae bacterium]|nr:hypothetical protein [Oscillospiraceae bacterium]